MSNIIKKEGSDLLNDYYLDYGMSVITDRALPDIRDNLKPVARRILYAMSCYLGLSSNKTHKKSARVVGEVLGRLHPHGDSSVYGALVRMAQWFSLGEPLVDGHGNFGKIDGSTPAAMRYTESRLSKIGELLLRDIEKETIDFIPNFDGEEREPLVLPSRLPNYLINGNTGVAVGFSTNTPPHNLRDTINQLIYNIDNPNCSIKDLVDILKCPDFPTGGKIIYNDDIQKIYEEGKGQVTIRGKYHIENDTTIVFTEIPFGTDINVTKISDSIKDNAFGYYKTKKDSKGKMVEIFIPPSIPQILQVNELSDDIQGVRIEIIVKNKKDINLVLTMLFKKTPLQSNFSVLFNAIKGKKLLQKLNLKQINKEYIDFQKEILTRRSKFDLNKAEAREHILEGLKIALDNIDEVIRIIKSSKTSENARNTLTERFNISEKQSNSIIEMRLRRLTGLERDKIEDELKELIKQIEYLNLILSSEVELLTLLKKELIEIRDQYGKERKTDIIYNDTLSNIDISNITIEQYNCRIFYTNKYIKKHLKQSDNHKIVEGNIILGDFTTTNKSTLLIFTNKERRYRIQCSDLEQYQPSTHGTFVPKLLEFEDDEQIIKILSIPTNGYKQTNIYFIYENGKIAKVNADSYMSNNKKLQNCYNTDSKLIDVYYSEKDIDILLCSSEGKALIVNTSQLNSKGSRNAQGVTSMKLEDNIIIGCIVDIDKDSSFTLKTQKGKEKEFVLSDISPTNKLNEERNVYQYIQGKCGNQGNFLINTRSTTDSIISLILNKK